MSGQRVAPGTATPRAARAAATSSAPKLAVVIVVDQMRADYIDRFQADWTGGLKRLVSQGARFADAAYPYLGTYTCAGHATISTGAFPHVHGIFQNTWYDPQRNPTDTIPCTDDESATPVVYGGKGKADGPGRLRVPSFADEMRAQKSSRVVSLALKARSAIMLAGHGGDAVTWMTDDMDGWQTSKAYASEPVAAVRSYLEQHPVDLDFGKTWDRLLPPARYTEVDDGEAEAPPKGWTRTFPHVLRGEGNSPDKQFHDQWQHSPFADTYVGRMAAALTEQFALGTRGTTDVLTVSFSSPDLVGHQFGPDSQEVRDMYAELDRTIGELLSRLDTLVGRGQYTVGLSADHGVTPIPEQLRRKGRSAGRLSAGAIRTTIEKAVAGVLGDGQYVARLNTNDVYFRPGVYEQLTQKPAALDAVIQAIVKTDGIDRVYRREQIANEANARDPILRAAALSYVPDRSGQLILVTKSGWMFSNDGTTHGSANADDQRVPVVFYGKGIKPGLYRGAATPADVTPTLAAVMGITMPKAEGHALTAALAGHR